MEKGAESNVLEETVVKTLQTEVDIEKTEKVAE